MKTLISSNESKCEDCRDCIYFQEAEELFMDKYNSSYDIALELNKFINECDKCEGDN